MFRRGTLPRPSAKSAVSNKFFIFLSYTVLLPILIGLLALGGCFHSKEDSSSNVDSPAGPTGQITTFSATPAAVAPGGSTTLAWATSSATSCSIDNGVGAVNPSGTTQVWPNAATTYTITCQGPDGPMTKQTTVAGIAAAVQITSFTATAGTIVPGASSTLTLAASNATSCSIDNGVGDIAPDGSATVSPAATTTYTVTCQGSGGPVSLQAIVTVTSNPLAVQIASLTAAPVTVTDGEVSTLSWTTPNATTCGINNGVGAVNSNDTVQVSPVSSTTYTLVCQGQDGPVSGQVSVTVNPAPFALTSLTPTTAPAGTTLRLNAVGVPASTAGMEVVFTLPDGTSIRGPVLSPGPRQLTAVSPLPLDTTATVSISTSSGSTNTLPFQAVASTDPTPTQAGNEVEAMFKGLSQLVAAADHELGIALYPFLNSAGAGAFGIKLSGTLTDFKTALDQYFANTLNSRLSAADWQAVDAIMGAEAATQALAGILAGADKLSHSTVGEAMLSLREVISKIREIRDTLNLVNDAILLATGPGTVLAPEIVPILLAVSEVLTTVIDALDTIRLILAQAPTSPVAETFEIFSYQPELLELNDQYIRNGHEPDPACILIPYPRNIRGRIDLNNRHAPSLQGLVEANLPPEFAFVVDLLHLDITPDLAVNDVEIKVDLRADTGGESLIRGNWLGDQGLEVKGLAPGDTTISIYPDLAEVNDQCPDNLPFGVSCIRLDEVSIRRNVRVYERPVIKSLSQNAAFIGDRITITGECTLWKPGYTDENYQDVFFTGPSDPQYGNGYVYDEDVGDNSYFGYSVIVPDAIPGATWFFIGSAESNHFPFTVNRPWLERVPPSAILGESWEITGRGFSGIPEHKTGIFKEVSTSLEAWADA